MISEAAKCAGECYDNARGVSGSEDVEIMTPIIQRYLDAQRIADIRALEAYAKRLYARGDEGHNVRATAVFNAADLIRQSIAKPDVQSAIDAETARLKERITQLEAAIDVLLGFEHINDRGSESGSWQSIELEEAFKQAKAARGSAK